MLEKYASGRNAYNYPPIGLVLRQPLGAVADWESAYEVHRFPSTLEIDNHHYQCLSSADDEAVILGLFSVVYWGYITSGSLSRARCNWLAVGKRQSPQNSLAHLGKAFAVDCVRRASRYLDAGDVALALREICKLPYVGLSFGTKILAFMDPETLGVLDDKITENMAVGTFGQVLEVEVIEKLKKPKYESPRRAEQRYVTFCQVLNGIKNDLNCEGMGWADASGASMTRFRAVDVERSLFAIASSRA